LSSSSFSLRVRVDLAYWGEFLLFLSFVGGFVVFATLAHTKTLVVNEAVGVVVVVAGIPFFLQF
jgi:hypothetical protein